MAASIEEKMSRKMMSPSLVAQSILDQTIRLQRCQSQKVHLLSFYSSNTIIFTLRQPLQSKEFPIAKQPISQYHKIWQYHNNLQMNLISC